MRDAVLMERAARMRREATLPERAVWRVLRVVPFDAWHFRRQVPFAARYIADFASHRRGVIVEVDGRSHDSSAERDAARTLWFEGEGYQVVRLSNEQAMDRDQDLGALLMSLLGV